MSDVGFRFRISGAVWVHCCISVAPVGGADSPAEFWLIPRRLEAGTVPAGGFGRGGLSGLLRLGCLQLAENFVGVEVHTVEAGFAGGRAMARESLACP